MSNSFGIVLAIAISIAIVPKKAIAIAVSILLLMSNRVVGQYKLFPSNHPIRQCFIT